VRSAEKGAGPHGVSTISESRAIHKLRNRTRLLALLVLGATLASAWVLLTASEHSRSETAKAGGALPAAPRVAYPADVPKRNLRIALSGAFVSESGLPVYGKISEYLASRIGHDCDLISGFSYSSIGAMLDAGAVDLAFVCGLPYVIDHDQPQPSITLVAAPVMKHSRYDGQPKYFSCVIVHKDSAFQRFEDLRGTTWVYNEATSNSGYNLPRCKLVSIGETHGFFGKVLRSGSHEESIRMVATHEADASAVDSLVLDYDAEHNDDFARAVRIIEMLGPAGIPPLVASAQLPEPLRARVRDVLTEMHRDPAGRAILDLALVDRFTAVDDSNYDDIRRMKQAAEQAGFLEIK
jgi:phosphonate transport system substrate-binding protein